ncbi:MAG: nucleotidyltransferase family protein [Pseudomonadota bacterium]
MSENAIDTAMVLAAGLGTRMRPLTNATPKPLVPFRGRPLVDYVFDRLGDAGIARAVVNLHYCPSQLEAHVSQRGGLDIVLSDERETLLDTGGGVKHALPLLGDTPFLVIASDTVWIEGARNNLHALMVGFDPDAMDILMLLAPTVTSVGLDGPGDYTMEADGRLKRRKPPLVAPFSYASAMVVHPRIYAETPAGPFSNNILFDRAEAEGRLYGMRLDGIWMHIGTPLALREAETAVRDAV